MSVGYRSYKASSGSVATTASTLKYILAVACLSTQDLALMGYRVSMDTSSGPVVLVEIVRLTALGTSSGTPSAYKWNNPDGIAANCLPKSTWSVNPTAGDVIEDFWLTPNQPTFMYDYTYGNYPRVSAGAANAICIRVTPGAASTPNVDASLVWAE